MVLATPISGESLSSRSSACCHPSDHRCRSHPGSRPRSTRRESSPAPLLVALPTATVVIGTQVRARGDDHSDIDGATASDAEAVAASEHIGILEPSKAGFFKVRSALLTESTPTTPQQANAA